MSGPIRFAETARSETMVLSRRRPLSGRRTHSVEEDMGQHNVHEVPVGLPVPGRESHAGRPAVVPAIAEVVVVVEREGEIESVDEFHRHLVPHGLELLHHNVIVHLHFVGIAGHVPGLARGRDGGPPDEQRLAIVGNRLVEVHPPSHGVVGYGQVIVDALVAVVQPRVHDDGVGGLGAIEMRHDHVLVLVVLQSVQPFAVVPEVVGPVEDHADMKGLVGPGGVDEELLVLALELEIRQVGLGRQLPVEDEEQQVADGVLEVGVAPHEEPAAVQAAPGLIALEDLEAAVRRVAPAVALEPAQRPRAPGLLAQEMLIRHAPEALLLVGLAGLAEPAAGPSARPVRAIEVLQRAPRHVPLERGVQHLRVRQNHVQLLHIEHLQHGVLLAEDVHAVPVAEQQPDLEAEHAGPARGDDELEPVGAVVVVRGREPRSVALVVEIDLVVIASRAPALAVGGVGHQSELVLGVGLQQHFALLGSRQALEAGVIRGLIVAQCGAVVDQQLVQGAGVGGAGRNIDVRVVGPRRGVLARASQRRGPQILHQIGDRVLPQAVEQEHDGPARHECRYHHHQLLLLLQMRHQSLRRPSPAWGRVLHRINLYQPVCLPACLSLSWPLTYLSIDHLL
ncbi:hypothetical protein Mapa_009047 [Marchantia paleacea]|nr:hypothetical protein Mapa_009047 [Marchantia paleacea]